MPFQQDETGQIIWVNDDQGQAPATDPATGNGPGPGGAIDPSIVPINAPQAAPSTPTPPKEQSASGPAARSVRNANAILDDWDRWPGLDFAAFLAAHPEYDVSFNGKDKATIDGQTFDVLIAASTGHPTGKSRSLVTAGGGGGNAIDPSYLSQYPGQFTPPDAQSPFSYADFQAPDRFKPPTADSILQDPSYQFRLNQGEGALENSAAARGVLNSGGTLKDILGYGQNFASQEYSNIWDRDFNAFNNDWMNQFNTYNTNRNNASDAFTKNYTLSNDTYNRAWNQFTNSQQDWYTAQNNAFSKLSSLANLGAGAA